MRKKIYSYLGFATKSRKLINGFNTCVFSMKKRNVKLLIVAEDISENTEEKILREAEKYGVTYRRFGSIEELSGITGEECAGIFGITDDNFANVILREIDEEKSMEKEVF